MTETTNDKIRDIITKVSKLGWVSQMDGNRYMGMADIEKMLTAILDDTYMLRINDWVEQAERSGDVCTEYPLLEPRDYKRNMRLLAFNSKTLGEIINGKRCVYKEGRCPFKK